MHECECEWEGWRCHKRNGGAVCAEEFPAHFVEWETGNVRGPAKVLVRETDIRDECIKQGQLHNTVISSMRAAVKAPFAAGATNAKDLLRSVAAS
jgi:hypothetical protein